jgi:hypothetical protein
MSRLACFVARFRPAWLAVTLSVVSLPALAQDTSQPPPAHVALVEGTAILERDGETDSSPANMPLLAGDRLRTRAGRVEVLFADGSTLHMDANTVVDFQSDEVIRLLDGRIRLNIAGPTRQIGYRIDAPSAWVEIRQPGEYRVALVGGAAAREVELAVLRGAADLINEDGVTELRAGERAFAAAGAAPSRPYVFNSAAWDAFDRWSEARRDQRLGISAQYLPAEVRPYAAALDQYGSWNYDAAYGYVWYPRVAVGWRPYYYGRWSHLRPWGWTWIGHDPWAWPTHHYGRWGFSAGIWFWIPGRHWGPAWVSWAYAPGYVSWCPLGWNNLAVVSFGNVHVFGSHRHHPWHAWTVVPHRRFGHGFVHANVVNASHIDARTRSAFAVRDAAPDVTGRAVPRAQAPIRVAGSRTGVAVPRGGSVIAGPNEQRSGGEAFRSRGTPGERLSGPGLPAPSREPRTAAPRRSDGTPAPRGTSPERRTPEDQQLDRGAPRAVPRSGAPSQVAPERGVPSRRATPDGARAQSPPAGRGGDAPAASGSDRPRAVPRGGAAAPSTPSRGTPSRGAVPRGRGGSDSPAALAPAAAAPSPERSRAVPRRSESYAPAAPRYTVPSQPYGGPSGRVDRTPDAPAYSPPSAIRRAPGGSEYRMPQPAPRSMPSGPPARVYGPDSRSGRSPGGGPSPSMPGPSRSVERGSSQGSSPSAGAPPSRSRGGQPASGGAVRRRGGGS